MESSIQVGVSGPAVWVRVEGKGSFLNSGNFKEFAREMVDRGYREFVVDLVDCVMMDSTFMGTMAGLALRLKELGQGHLQVVHCGERSRQLLSGLGLDQLFQISSNGARAPECGALAIQQPWKKKSKPRKCWKRTKRCVKRRRKIFCGSKTFSTTSSKTFTHNPVKK